jgi:hypothetical protein
MRLIPSPNDERDKSWWGGVDGDLKQTAPLLAFKSINHLEGLAGNGHLVITVEQRSLGRLLAIGDDCALCLQWRRSLKRNFFCAG